MGLLKGEIWNDYLDEDVYVSSDNGVTGFIGIMERWDNDIVVVKEEDTGEMHELPHDVVYGLWILEDW